MSEGTRIDGAYTKTSVNVPPYVGKSFSYQFLMGKEDVVKIHSVYAYPDGTIWDFSGCVDHVRLLSSS
jgi:hypothetical protein